MTETPIPSNSAVVPTATPTDPAVITDKARAVALVRHFKLERVLNADQASRRVTLLGTLHEEPTLLVLERAPLPSDTTALSALPNALVHLKNLGYNPPYSWYLASLPVSDEEPGVKVNLIHPCTPSHVRKYEKQRVRVVTETAQVFREKVKPWVEKQVARVGWVYSILDGTTEQEDILLRHPDGESGKEGFVLLPDLNWDRQTLTTLHLLCLVTRRDLHSLRDLRVSHVPWLKAMRTKLLSAACELYPTIEVDELKFYLHYQPTYHHLHIHIVHVLLEAGPTQALGKAFGLENVISQLEGMGGDDRGMADVDLTYTIGEGSELWETVFAPLKAEAGIAKENKKAA